MNIRKIIHVDMDAFYASIEQRDHPELKGKPIAVGGNAERGVIAAASYEARVFGIKSAMPSMIAVKKCPHLIFVKPNFEKYSFVSQQIRTIFLEYSDKVEPLSLDEAYIDVTHNKKGMLSASMIAKEIRSKIFEVTGLTASAGISINKFLAKVGSDLNKPNGQFLIPPSDALRFIEQLPVKKFPYVGAKTAQKMYKLGIYNGGDLKKLSEIQLNQQFGKQGTYYYQVVRCIQNSEVISSRLRKSLAVERTLMNNIVGVDLCLQELDYVLNELDRRLKKSKLSAKTITLKIKYHNFEIQSKSKSLIHYTNKITQIFEVIKVLLNAIDIAQKPIRLIGISLSNLNNKQEVYEQLTFNF